MPDDVEIDGAEVKRLAEAAELKRTTIAEHARLTTITGQMQSNTNRMEREGTIGAAALDFKSDENIAPDATPEGEYALVPVGGSIRKVKTQYMIDKAILDDHQGQLDNLLAEHSQFLETEIIEEVTL